MARETTTTLNKVSVTLLEVKFGLTGCSSLKEKRSRLKPVLFRIHKEYNVSVAETGLHDVWQSAWITCALVSNDPQFNSRLANEILRKIETLYPDLLIDEYHIEYR